MTVEEFLAWEERQELRHEFDGIQPRAMVGVTNAHAAIQTNLITALTNRLRGTPCRARGSDLKIMVAGRIRYPDALVFCKPVPPDTRVITEPVVVFEILSSSTAHQDLVTKNAEYRATPSIQRYVILQQAGAGATVFSRKGSDWVSDIVAGEGAVLNVPEISIEIPLAELYIDVEFPPPAEDDETRP